MGLTARTVRILAAAAALFMLAGAAMAGEEATTRRAGDLILYRFACHDAESMTAIAGRGGSNELVFLLMSREKCFNSKGPIAARLDAWIAGPYAPPAAPAGSVWRVIDQYDDTEYIWINDKGGPHEIEENAILWPQSGRMALSH